MRKILIIQTAFIGDVVLATVLIEKIKDLYPDAQIDFLLRQGNETLLRNHPKLNEVIVWNKRRKKYLNFFKILRKVRSNKYDLLINVHRFSSSGIITCFSSASKKIGFTKNPMSFCYDEKVEHDIGDNTHEIVRNLKLIESLGGHINYKPKLYFTTDDERAIEELVEKPYVVIAPASVWLTKQFPVEKWVELVQKIPANNNIYLIGGGNDVRLCEKLISKSGRENMRNLTGKLSFLESAALMKNAEMNFVNDSAPMHFASSVNAPTTAVFCSTIPEFGFGPLSDGSKVLQITDPLDCRPCGLHGFKSCPKGHFKCAFNIEIPDSVME